MIKQASFFKQASLELQSLFLANIKLKLFNICFIQFRNNKRTVMVQGSGAS